MGAKKLKAVAVRGSFDEAYMKMREILDLKGSDMYIIPYTIFGSPSQMRIFSEAGMAHTYNAQTLRFKFADDCSGEKYLEKYVVRPLACFCCFIPCKRWYEIREGPYAGTKGGNYHAGGQIVFNSNTGVKRLDAGLKAWTLCNQLGLDVYHVGYSIAWAMECFEKGILTTKDTDGIELRFGNHEAMIEMIRKIAYRDGFGDVLADGVSEAAKK